MKWICVVAGLMLALGCTAPQPALDVNDPDPSVKIPAMKKAVREHDMKSLTQMVADLESDDPAVRFYAINSLHRLTDERFGYDYYADETDRIQAVARWKQWLEAERADRTAKAER